MADGTFELGRGEEQLLGGFSIGETTGAEVVAVLVFGVADVRDIDAADEAEFAQAGGDGDERPAIVALALAAKMLLGDLGRLAAPGTADAEWQVNSVARMKEQSSFSWRIGAMQAKPAAGGGGLGVRFATPEVDKAGRAGDQH